MHSIIQLPRPRHMHILTMSGASADSYAQRYPIIFSSIRSHFKFALLLLLGSISHWCSQSIMGKPSSLGFIHTTIIPHSCLFSSILGYNTNRCPQVLHSFYDYPSITCVLASLMTILMSHRRVIVPSSPNLQYSPWHRHS